MSSVTIKNVTKSFGSAVVLDNFDAVFADGVPTGFELRLDQRKNSSPFAQHIAQGGQNLQN